MPESGQRPPYAGRVFRYALALTCDWAQAEDVTHAALRLGTYAPETWLKVAAFGVCRRWFDETDGDLASDVLRISPDGPFGCAEAELAVSLRLDGKLTR